MMLPSGLPTMLTYDHAWPESFDSCPCDRDFVDWLLKKEVSGQTIFHFGTGAHHTVGMSAASLENHVIGLTASRGEMDAYEEWAIIMPHRAQCYQVIFGDIYTINPRLLPDLDIVTLFHLCEFTDARRAEYGGCDDREVALRLLSRMKPDGSLLGYPGSMAWVRAEPIFAGLVEEGLLREPVLWRSLAIYKVPDGVSTCYACAQPAPRAAWVYLLYFCPEGGQHNRCPRCGHDGAMATEPRCSHWRPIAGGS